jgi:hypothetical protein
MKELPIVMFNGKKYYLDARLNQLRSKTNPHDFIDLTDLEVAWLLLQI